MRIAMIGSWRGDQPETPTLTDHEHFPEACRMLAERIVTNGHQIVIGGQPSGTADFHAVEGVIRALESRRNDFSLPPIMIIRPKEEMERPYESWRREYGRLFTERTAPGSRWSLTKLFQVKDADEVIVIGGTELSYQAGLAAGVSGKRLVPIGSFGGAGEKLIEVLSSSRNCWPPATAPTADELGELRNPWSQSVLEKAIHLLQLIPRILIIHGHTNDFEVLGDHLRGELSLPAPVIMKMTPGEGQTLPEKFESLADSVQGAIALISPDDIGSLAGADSPTQRARQNVWLEVGWIWGRLGRERVLPLMKGNLEIPSDLHGLEFYQYQNSPLEQSTQISHFVRLCAEGRRR
ncbi:MAG TPA: TIR domain-containing protein [Nitrospiraceae bacterium]|nr:TIR domain-containing protein [Nitrospiraceae bacterium]